MHGRSELICHVFHIISFRFEDVRFDIVEVGGVVFEGILLWWSVLVCPLTL